MTPYEKRRMYKIERQFFNWILAWIEIAMGIVGVLSLGYIYMEWDLEFMSWQVKRDFIKRREYGERMKNETH